MPAVRTSDAAAVGRASATITQAHGDDQAQPEHEAAEDRKALADRQAAMLPEAPRIAPPRRQLPHPADQQHARRNQQPQVLRLREPHRLEINARALSIPSILHLA